MKRFLLIVVAAIAACLGFGAPSASAVEVPILGVHSHSHSYDSHAQPAALAGTATERGPSAYDHAATTHNAVVLRSDGALAGPSNAAPRAICACDAPVIPAQVDSAAGTTSGPTGANSGYLSSFELSRVAAKTAPELASGLERTGTALSKSDAFHRSVSWVVDNSAAQRFAIKGGDGVSRELYQLPGEVNGKSGVFEWIIDRSGSNPAINHQRFIPGGSVTGYPNQVVP